MISVSGVERREEWKKEKEDLTCILQPSGESVCVSCVEGREGALYESGSRPRDGGVNAYCKVWQVKKSI